jgi:hypothetical protein
MIGNDGNGFAKISLIGKANISEFDYTGAEQTFTAPVSGYYKLETWGAQGGSISTSSENVEGGYGGYASGKIFLNEGDILYINVGSQGVGGTGSVESSYNGGGSAYTTISSEIVASGGGATHIATSSGLLSNLSSNKSSVIIVAGGGGGSFSDDDHNVTAIGGNGGGKNGTLGTNSAGYGTQTDGGAGTNPGTDGSFGAGGSGYSWSAGGGAGYYGGGGGYGTSGGGGSGYIGNSNLFDKHMVCYNCTTSSDENTLTLSNEEVSEEPLIDKSKKGNGYARITLIDEDLSNHVYYSNGVSYENLSTSNAWQTDEAEFLTDSIHLKTNGYNIVYTDEIDLSLYNSVIIRKTDFESSRAGFLQYPNKVNEEGISYNPTWNNISGTDIYVADISDRNDNNLHFYVNSWNGTNSGYVYYISFSTKSISEIQSDYSFVE